MRARWQLRFRTQIPLVETSFQTWYGYYMRGFTLIELLVVVSIMVGLVALVLPQFNNFNRAKAVQTSAEELQSALRFAQSSASSGVQCDLTSIQASNWYLKFFDNATYKIETTCTNSSVGSGTPTPTPPFIKAYSLPSGVVVQAVIIQIPSLPDCPVSLPQRITFSNISGAIRFPDTEVSCPTQQVNSKLKITLQFGSDVMSVIVEKGGPIYISSE